MVSTQSRVNRTLKRLDQFETDISGAALEELRINNFLSDGDQLLGIYRNKKGNNSFAITDQALIVFEEFSRQRFYFSEMESSAIAANEKSTADEINIKLKSGRLITVFVDGGDGRFRDVFECGRFFSRVIEDKYKALGLK